jgi:endonuclease IV
LAYGLMCLPTPAGLDYSADYILPHGSYLINLGNPDA